MGCRSSAVGPPGATVRRAAPYISPAAGSGERGQLERPNEHFEPAILNLEGSCSDRCQVLGGAGAACESLFLVGAHAKPC